MKAEENEKKVLTYLGRFVFSNWRPAGKVYNVEVL